MFFVALIFGLQRFPASNLSVPRVHVSGISMISRDFGVIRRIRNVMVVVGIIVVVCYYCGGC